nr:kinase-like domain,concanavalin A-like lectin/glucanase domain protein [Tanacetum cinerariifolium]
MGVLFLVALTYILYKFIKKTKERRRRKRFFKRNGGLLLKQQEEADPSLVDQTILFTSRQLEKATDSFNENRV